MLGFSKFTTKFNVYLYQQIENIYSKNTRIRMNSTTSKILQFIITIALVGFSIYFAVSNINFAKLFGYIQSVNYLWYLATIPIVIASHYLRAMRWKILINPIQQHTKTFNLFSAIMVGYGINNVIPRGGELVRPYVVAKREGIPIASLVGTVVLERFFDVLNLLLFISIATFLFTDKLRIALPSVTTSQMIVYAGIPTVILLGLIIIFAFTTFGQTLVSVMVKPLPKSIGERILSLLSSFTQGLSIVKQPKAFIPLIIQSMGIWILYVLPIYVLFFAFNLHHQLHLIDAVILLIITSVGVAIAPTPGTVGVYHLFMQEAMYRLYAIPLEEGLAFATLSHSVHYLLSFLLGGLFMLRENISPKETLTHPSEEKN